MTIISRYVLFFLSPSGFSERSVQLQVFCQSVMLIPYKFRVFHMQSSLSILSERKPYYASTVNDALLAGLETRLF